MAITCIPSTIDLDVLEEQLIYYRTHLDVFIEDAFPPIRLSRDQHVIARAFGNCSDIKIVQSRGSGKTWLVALCCHAMCCLYPGTLVAVCSATAAQATLVLEKLKMFADQNPNIANELTAGSARTLVQLSKDKGRAVYKNTSKIESFAIDSMRGQRAKIVVCDEDRDIDQEAENAVVVPVKNYRRDISFNYGFEDYVSKFVSMTSACEKAKSYYGEFERVVRQMANGNRESFACALDYRAAVANGVNDADFFEGERSRQPEAVFQMEYGSRFIGSTNGSAFPYELTTGCRTLQHIELSQPKNSKSRYVICLDIATSEAKEADNSIATVLKFTERSDARYAVKLVYMRSYHGKSLDFLAEQIRILYHIQFPNTEKIVYDARGLGDSLDRFFDKEWVNPVDGREYPPLVVDDKPNVNFEAKAILHPFRAVQQLNQRIYTNMRVSLEKRLVELPVSSRAIQLQEAGIKDQSKWMPMEEKAIFEETDALIYEMGNIIAKTSASGNVIYDTPRLTLHKDRYSSFAMGMDYIRELEKENVKRHTRKVPCIGIATNF